MTTDKFGITKLYDTMSNGREWFSKWDDGHARTFDNSRINDPDDPEFWTKGKGTGLYYADGNGILKISGSTPRMYIIDTGGIKYWHNVEITVYGKRFYDSNVSYGGIMAYVRTNHMITSNYCDTRGYGGRFKYNGDIDFVKETKHDAGYDQVAQKRYWPDGMPKKVWIGYKYIVKDMPDGNVKLELYIDNTDGVNGGNWVKINEFIDDGNNFGVGYAACKTGIDPALRLTSSDSRPGSESGKPNLSVYFRSTGVYTKGLWYKKMSIREISKIT